MSRWTHPVSTLTSPRLCFLVSAHQGQVHGQSGGPWECFLRRGSVGNAQPHPSLGIWNGTVFTWTCSIGLLPPGVRALIQSVSCPIVFGGLLLVCLKYADYDLLNWEAQPLTRGCWVAFSAPRLPLPGRENPQSHVYWRCGFKALNGEKSSHRNLSFQIPEKEGCGELGKPTSEAEAEQAPVTCTVLRPEATDFLWTPF